MKECEGDGCQRKSAAVEKECRTSGGQTDMTDHWPLSTDRTLRGGCAVQWRWKRTCTGRCQPSSHRRRCNALSLSCRPRHGPSASNETSGYWRPECARCRWPWRHIRSLWRLIHAPLGRWFFPRRRSPVMCQLCTDLQRASQGSSEDLGKMYWRVKRLRTFNRTQQNDVHAFGKHAFSHETNQHYFTRNIGQT